MRPTRWKTLMILVAFTLPALCPIQGATGRIIKTLPHYLDLQGRHILHPSLFERDAYQAELRSRPELCSGMRFDVQWKARELKGKRARLRLELKGEKLPPRKVELIERELDASGWFSRWTGLVVAGEDFKRIGAIKAWRVTLWSGDELLAEKKSFLW